MNTPTASRIISHLKKCSSHKERAIYIKDCAKQLSNEPPEAVIDIAKALWETAPSFWNQSFLLHLHPTALQRIRVRDLETMGDLADTWGKVDQFCSMTNTLWRLGWLSDARLRKWAVSENRWWRRIALVTMVIKPPKNTTQRKLLIKTHGRHHDPKRVLPICEMLVSDRDDMVVKAMSWVLRDVSKAHPKVIRDFLKKHEDVLAARVLREVRNKLEYGVKNPKKGIHRVS